MERLLFLIDRISAGVGKAFGWCIVILTLAISYEVFVRYVLRAPTQWAYDVSYIMYGALFLMAGAYTLSRNSHVRGDVFYRLLPVRLQAGIDLVLFILFYFPAVLALIYSGYGFASMSLRFKEVSVFSPAGVPIYPLKLLIPVSGVFLLLQGLAELTRCVICLRTGDWPRRLHDVEEMETVILHEHEFRAEHPELEGEGERA
jgi:TRAP-type mannitol/chloroaromatic compound transport system permease small subunit